MKYHTLLNIILAATALFTGCSDLETAPAEPAFLSFGVVDFGERTHVGKIDNQFKTIKINTITSAADIKDVKFRLTPGTTIDPSPATLVLDCQKNNKFRLESGENEVEWHVLFPNFEKEDAQKEWVLDWEENFDGDSFNDEVWSKTPKGKSDWCTQMAPYEDLYEVKDGILTLWAKKNDLHPEDERTCLTGGLWTRDQKAFKEGKIVIRARHDKGQGFWPALWLRPQDGPSDEYSEIDIVELVKGKAYQTIHTDYTLANKEKPGLGNSVTIDLNDNEGWHEYAVEINQNKIVLSVDGKDRLTYHKRPDLDTGGLQNFPFGDRSFYLILSAQLGGKWAGEPSLSALPLKFQIDYVKYYVYR